MDEEHPESAAWADEVVPDVPADRSALPPEDGGPQPDSDGTPSDTTLAPAADADSIASITEGTLWRAILHLTWPIVVIQLLQVTYNLVDTVYLGRLSASAVGAVSLAFPLVFLMIAIAGGFTTAGAILVARNTGARGTDRAGRAAGQTLLVVTVVSAVLAVMGSVFTRPLLEALPSDQATAAVVIPLAADYLEIVFLGIPLMFAFFLFAALMRGHGDTRTPMLVMVASVLANVVIDPLFIFGFAGNPLLGTLPGIEQTLYSLTGFSGWGVEGAAVATVISRGLAGAIGLWIILGTARGPAIELGHLWPDREMLTRLVRLGLPATLEQSTSSLAMVTISVLVLSFSPPVVAAFGLGNRLMALVFLPAIGLGQAMDTVVGQNLGAGEYNRAERAVRLAIGAGGAVMFLVAIGAVLLARPISGLFLGEVPNAPATLAYSVEYVRIRSVEFTFVGVTHAVLGAFRGAGYTGRAMVVALCTQWIGAVSAVSVLVLALGTGPRGVWFGIAIGHIVGAVVGISWLRYSRWTTPRQSSQSSENGRGVPAD